MRHRNSPRALSPRTSPVAFSTPILNLPAWTKGCDVMTGHAYNQKLAGPVLLFLRRKWVWIARAEQQAARGVPAA